MAILNKSQFSNPVPGQQLESVKYNTDIELLITAINVLNERVHSGNLKSVKGELANQQALQALDINSLDFGDRYIVVDDSVYNGKGTGKEYVTYAVIDTTPGTATRTKGWSVDSIGVPVATEINDGLLTKEDFAKLRDLPLGADYNQAINRLENLINGNTNNLSTIASDIATIKTSLNSLTSSKVDKTTYESEKISQDNRINNKLDNNAGSDSEKGKAVFRNAPGTGFDYKTPNEIADEITNAKWKERHRESVGPAYDDTNLQNQITVNADNHRALQAEFDGVKGSATGSGQKKDLDEFDGTTDDKTLASEKFVLDHLSGNFKDMRTYSFAGKTKNDIYNDFLNDPNGTIYIFGNITITIGTSESLSFIKPTPTTYSGAMGWKQQSEHGNDFQLTIFSAGDMWNVSADQNDPSYEIFNVGKATRNQALVTNSDRMITEIHVAGVNSFEGSFSSGQKLDQFAAITTTVPAGYQNGYINFGNERNLKSLNMPQVQTIGNYAFRNSRLTNLSLPLATSIGNGAFNNSRLTSLSLPLATSIGNYAFQTSQLTSLSIPLATNIGNSAFNYIVNSNTTTARLNVKFNTSAEKDRIFGSGKWNNIQFTWTNNQGQDINPQPAPTPQPAPPVPVEQRIADLEAKIAILTNEVENK